MERLRDCADKTNEIFELNCSCAKMALVAQQKGELHQIFPHIERKMSFSFCKNARKAPTRIVQITFHMYVYTRSNDQIYSGCFVFQTFVLLFLRSSRCRCKREG